MGTMTAAYMKTYRAKRAARESEDGLLCYQRQFLSAVSRRDNRPEIAALSIGRGNGKTFLAGEILARALKPSDDPLFVSGSESVLVSASRPMATLTLEAAHLVLGDDPEFRWRRDGVEHLKTRTRCRVLSSDSRRAYGLGADLNIAVLDEPGSFAPTSGERLWRALLGSLGKNSSSRILAKEVRHDCACRRRIMVAGLRRIGIRSWEARPVDPGRREDLAVLGRGPGREPGLCDQQKHGADAAARAR